jgi:hypothetical protein
MTTASRLSLIFVGASLLFGCRAATYDASRAVSPVLVGPVRCIGCAPTETPRASEGDLTDEVIVENFAGSSPSVTVIRDTTGFPQLVLQAGLAIPDACRGDIQITHIHAASYGTVLLGGAATTAKIEISARPVPVPTGSCARRPWPYVGPAGVVPFDWPVAGTSTPAP